MSWSENGRKNRMTKIMELLKLNRQGLQPSVIARETGMLEEITKQRFIMYIEELKWAHKIIEERDGRIRLRDER